MGCVPVVLEDLNINFRDPRNKRKELIVDLLDNINLVDTSRRYTPRRPHKQSTRAQWTWRHKREGRTHYLQLDCILARKGTAGRLRNVGFCWPQYHDLDHQAVITAIRTRMGWLTAYRRKRQEFPLKLPPKELRDDLTQAFENLNATCEEPTAMKYHWRNWMSDTRWLLIRQRTLLKWAGQLCRCAGQRMQRTIYAALKKDRAACTAQVGDSIVAKLAKGNVHEAFRHLKGWYWSATNAQVQPCYQTMEKQMLEQAELYRRRDSPGPPLTVNVGLHTGAIRDNKPINGKIRVAVVELTNGCSAGASRMWAEHLKE